MTLSEPPAPAALPPSEPQRQRPAAPADREMTMLEHLAELRQRLVAVVLAVVAGIVVTLVPWPGFNSLTNFIVAKLVAQAPNGTVIATRPGEAFFTYLQVSLLLGVALAMPVIIYQALAFVAPALYPHEKRYLYLAIPGASASFLAGALFTYVVLLPVAIQFLGGFAVDVINPLWSAENYIDFVTAFLFWVGVTFELPIVMYFLTKLGVVSQQRLVGFRKYALVLAFVIGAVITPTPDPVNQTLVSVPIYLLFELGIILSRFA